MDEALEDARFLAGSSNRVAALDVLASGPTSRDELSSSVDASKGTIRRILRDFEDRGWVEQEGATYTTTEAGETIAVEFTCLLDTIRATYRLDGAQEWLPTDALGFGLDRLADARVTLPQEDHVITPLDRMDALVRDASVSRIFSPGVSISTVSANRDAVVENGQQMELVLTERVVSTIVERSDLAAMMRDMVETGRVTVFEIENDVPPMTLCILDGVVVLGLIGNGLPVGVVESSDEIVRQWADEFFEDKQERGDELPATAFSSGSGTR
ncbi:helix-turn-helix transcriptional regulator [Haloferax sp. YSSS75]|uniref:helix-turn-helix transcriptional regulator n=1 Tax=Haloferax sp. YSSS75 TaxID=3388564 RepID=UPI00398C8FED